MTPKPARSVKVAKLAAALLLAGVAGGAWFLRQAAPPPAAPIEHSDPIEPHEEEQKLFRAAQAALAAGDTDAAFSLLYEQATKFPKGALAPAREVAHATALCRAGKQADARAEAAAFVAAHPDSPLSKEARAICAP
jgi:outer membrane protein assembly factor BamD (BamD/ComL family)